MNLENSEISLDKLPDPENHDAVFRFAMSFDGYKYFGSFEASAENAQRRSRTSLTDVRNELFFEARASRHGDGDEYIETYKELLPVLRKFITC